MPPLLQNDFFNLIINPENGNWNLTGRQTDYPKLLNIHISLRYHTSHGKYAVLQNWRPYKVMQTKADLSPHGPLSQMEVMIGPDPNQLYYKITFALPEQQPFLLWKITVDNQSLAPIYLDKLELLNLHLGEIHNQPGDIAFFSNGWQSWSYSGIYQTTDRYRRTRLGPIRKPVVVNASTSQPRQIGRFTSDMFGILGNRSTRIAILAGFLSQKEHFGSLETHLGSDNVDLCLWAAGDGARLDAGEQTSTDWACLSFLHIDSSDPLGPYMEAVARENAVHLHTETPTGWCSWYQFLSEGYIGTVSDADIRHNLQTAASLHTELPLKLIQIDDGFESRVGDWFSFTPAFSTGLSTLAAEIKQAGFTPGLWLAPFIVHPKSRLYADHPDWLLRGRNGRPINAGFCWNAFTAALDLTHPKALNYACQVMKTAVQDWSFPYIKLDFLYAGALPGIHQDARQTRAQVLRTGLEALRTAAGPDTMLLGCGCPLGPAIGLVDAMRISTDTARFWYPAYDKIQFFFKDEVSLPSARYAAHNVLTRAPMHRRWWINDPDCLLVRAGTHLTLTEVQTVATVIALTGGSFLLSDHLPDLTPDRLRIAQALLPLIGKTPDILDWFDSPTPTHVKLDLEGPHGQWHLVALFNWADEPLTLELRLDETHLDPQRSYYAHEFWSQKPYHILPLDPDNPDSGKLTLPPVPAHGVALFAVRQIEPHQPQYLGSNLHISQGLEVTGWDVSENHLDLRLERPGYAQGDIFLSLPYSPNQILLNDQPILCQNPTSGIYRFAIEFNQRALIKVYKA
jgi:alpha-galactosidase